MKPIGKTKTREAKRYRRHLRVRKKVQGTAERPRVAVYRSLKFTYAQLIDDVRGHTLASASSKEKGFSAEKPGKVGAGFAVGQLLAQRASEAGVKKVVFDRAGYPYHGRVRAVADGARDGGLEF